VCGKNQPGCCRRSVAIVQDINMVMHTTRSVRPALHAANRPALAALVSAALVLQAGCSGGKSNKRESATEEPADAAASDADQTGAAVAKEPKPATKKKKPGSAAGGHIGEIPIDVWPEVWLKQPLAVVGEVGPAAAVEVADAAVPKNADPPPNAVKASRPGDTAAPGISEWQALISGETLADETKSLKNSLTAKMQDVGRYNSTYKELRVDAAVLSALAAVAIELPDGPSWKKNAKYIRDTASQVSGESKANGDKFYKKAKEAYDKLEALLAGSKPPDVEESADKVKFSELVNRYYVMERLKRTSNWMKTDVNSEAIFKKQGSKVSQEAAVLAILGKVIATPDYPDADLDDYRNFAGTVSQSGHEIAEAVKNDDFKAFTAALDRCLKACNQCHEQFKNN
jgi:hypothetical protein